MSNKFKVVEYEQDWINYEDEETEVQIEISNIIFDNLLEELSEEMLHISDRRSLDYYFTPN